MSWSINHSNPHPSRRRIRPINRTRENPDIGSDVYRRRQPAITGTYPNTGFVRYDFESLIESLNSSAFEASQHFALNSAPVARRYPVRSSRTATLRRITDSVVGNRRRQAPRAPSFSPDTTPQPHLFTTRQPTPIPTSSMISEARATAANNLRLSRSIGANTETGRNIGRRGLFGRVLHSASRDSDMLIDNEIDRLMFLDNNDRDSWPAVAYLSGNPLMISHDYHLRADFSIPDYVQSRRIEANPEPFDEPAILKFGCVSNESLSCTICLDEEVDDPICCLHCHQQIGCFGCIKKWISSDSIKSRINNASYAVHSAQTSCPLCRSQWSSARPEVFRKQINREVKTEI